VLRSFRFLLAFCSLVNIRQLINDVSRTIQNSEKVFQYTMVVAPYTETDSSNLVVHEIEALEVDEIQFFWCR